MDNRQSLIDIANGNRPGYWIETLHHEDGTLCYALHRPTRNQRNADDADKLAAGFPYTWEGLQIMAAKYLGREDAADTLEQYDDGRTAKGRIISANEAAAFAKWIKV